MTATKSQSISLALEGDKTNLPHNNREKEEMKKKRNNHVDKDRIKNNVYLKQESIEEKYEEIFGDALEKYNNKQRRNDRKIENYYEHIKNSDKTIEQREMIVQVGTFDDILSGDMDPEVSKEILLEYYDGFQDRNPNLELYNAVLHMDEATPHLHLNMIPVGRGYKRGMEKQVAFDRALSQQGGDYDKSKPFPEWREQEVAVIEEIMASKGIKRKEVGTHDTMSVDRYKEVRDREKAVEKREEKQLIKDKEQAAKGRILNSKELNMENKAESLKEDRKALEGSKNDFEAYVAEKEEEFEDKDAKLADRAQNIGDRELLVGERENSVKEEEEALKDSREAFESYVELVQESLKEEVEKAITEKTGFREMMRQAHTWTTDKLESLKDKLSESIDLTTEDLAGLEDEKAKINGLTADDLKDLVEDDSKQL